MPLFFFNIRNGDGFTADEEGRDCLDAAKARDEAIHDIRSIVGEEAKSGRIDLRGAIEVTDEEGREIDRVAFAEAVRILSDGRSGGG